MFDCRKKDCNGKYRVKAYADPPKIAFCDKCNHQITLSDLRDEQIDHDIKEMKEKDL